MHFIRYAAALLTLIVSYAAHADGAAPKVDIFYLPRDIEIELALAAGPEHIRQDASVYIFGKSGIAYMLKGDILFDEKTQKIETLFHSHYMLYAPGVSNKDLGVTDNALRANPSLPFIYDGYSGGTRTAYIIVPAASQTGHSHH